MRETTDLTQFLAENETESTREFERKLDEEFELADRYKQLAEVARNLFKRTLVAYGGEDVSIVEIDDYRKQLEELGVEV